MKRIIDLQKNVNEVTITLDYEDYVRLMATIKCIVDDPRTEKITYVKNLKEIKELIESIEPEYIWDEI